MADRDRNAVDCKALQAGLRESTTLTKLESAHVETCDACLQAWLDATVTQVPDATPPVKIPADFAARVTAQLPEKHSTPAGTRSSTPHWGLITAIVLVTCGMIGTAIADPSGLTTRMGIIFLLIVASEIAGIALWLGFGGWAERPRW